MKFTKMHGLGNDYIYFDCIDQPDLIPNPAETAARLADRHVGIGGDGIILILGNDDADFEMRMFNADGSEGEMCGNGIRCVGKYVFDNGYTTKRNITVMTGAGVKELNLIDEGGKVREVRVNMGEPILNGPEIPVALAKDPIVDEPISINGKEYRMTCVSMGNPHCVIFAPLLTDNLVFRVGSELELHELFPQRVNVEFIKVLSRSEVDMRVWERGSGETMACGTGAAAAGVAGVLKGLTNRDIVVHLRGGDLRIEWADDNHVYMTGPATYVFNGEVEI